MVVRLHTVLLVVLAAAAAGATAGATAGAGGTAAGAALTQCTTLECWVSGLEVGIPDVSETVESFAVALDGGECSKFVLAGVSVSGAPSTTAPTDTLLSVGVEHLGLACSGSWSAHELKFPHLHGDGTFVLDVAAGTRLDVVLDLDAAANNFPSAVTVASCAATVVLGDVHFTGGVVADAMDLVIKLLHSKINAAVSAALCADVMLQVAGQVSDVLHDVSDEVGTCVADRKSAPPPPIGPIPPGGLVNLRTNPVVAVIDYVLDNVTTSHGFDVLIDELTDGTGVYTTFLNTSTSVALLNNTAHVTIDWGMVGLSGLDSFNQLGVLQPSVSSPYMLDSVVAISDLAANISFCFSLTADALAGEGVLTDCGTVSGTLTGTTVNVTILAELNDAFLNSLAPSQLISAGNLLASVDKLAFESLWFNASFVDITVFGLNGTAGTELNDAVLGLLRFLEYGFTSSLPGALDCVVVPLALPEVNDAVALTLTKLKKEYPMTGPTDQESSFTRASVIGSAVGFVVFGAAIVAYLWRASAAADRITTLPAGSEAAYAAGLADLPMALHPELSPVLRFIAVFVTLVNMACIVNVSAGTVAFLFAYFKLGANEAHLPSLYSFSLGSSIRAFWDAGVYPPSVLLAIWSGAWPYFKHLGLLAAMLVPPSILKRRYRLWLIHFINFMGTWLLISVYSTFLVMITLHVKLVAPPDVAPEQQLLVDVAVKPVWGMYVEVWTLCVALILTSIVLKLHRDEVVAEQDAIDHGIAPQPHLLSLSSSAHPAIKAFVLIGLVGAMVCISLSAVIDLFNISLHGAIALVLDTLNLPTARSYDLFDMGQAFADSTHLPITFGVRMLQVMYYMASLFFPLLACVLGAMVWLIPMPVDTQRTLIFGVEIFVAWSGIDVAAAALVAGLAQLRTFIYSVTHDYCTALRPILNEYLAEPLAGDTHCFDAQASLEHGCWVMTTGAILFVIVMAVIIHHADAQLFTLRHDPATVSKMGGAHGLAINDPSSPLTDVYFDAGSARQPLLQ